MTYILLTAGIQVLCAKIDLRMDAALEDQVDPFNEHRIRNIYIDKGHGCSSESILFMWFIWSISFTTRQTRKTRKTR
jgi:hypothetical protein